MTKSSHDHLSEIVRRMESPKTWAEGLRSDRDHLAKILRAAKIRVKENKAKNGGIYIPA